MNQAGDAFDHWFEHFEERDKLAGWNSEQKLRHLKLLLDKTIVYSICSQKLIVPESNFSSAEVLEELCDLESSSTSPKNITHPPQTNGLVK